MREVIEKSQPENNIPQASIKHTPSTIRRKEGVIFDTELENTLKNMKNKTGFFKKQMKTRKVVGFGMIILLKYQVGRK